jgi:hypothetical protein
MDSPLDMPLDEFVATYVAPAVKELARKFLAGEPLDEIERRIIQDWLEHRASTVFHE